MPLSVEALCQTEHPVMPSAEEYIGIYGVFELIVDL